MKLALVNDVQEISGSAYRAFISTFHYFETDSEPDDLDPDPSDSDTDILDVFGCGEITPEVESMVEDQWKICDPLHEVYGPTTSKFIQETVKTATEESQCAGLNLFQHLTPGEDRNLIETCTAISFWCCCETIKKVSPIIAEASLNLMY